MSLHTYRPSDLEPLTGAIRALHSIEGLPCIELRHAGEAFTAPLLCKIREKTDGYSHSLEKESEIS